MTNRTRYIIAFTVLSMAAAFLVPAMPQPLEYHDFADHRTMFGVVNFLNVVSNVGFLLVGIAGIFVVIHPRTRFQHSSERWPYAIFFVGMLLTAAGSSYYHLAPDNERLFWDRMPMTIAFMALIAAQIVDRINVRAGLVLLLPMLFVGAASVIYWRATERAGAGNVMPYAILQGYAVVILVLMTALQPSRYTRGNDIYWVFAAYVIAKVFELFDEAVLALGNVVSGHTLKHLAAAAAGLVVCRMLLLRRLESQRRGALPRAPAVLESRHYGRMSTPRISSLHTFQVPFSWWKSTIVSVTLSAKPEPGLPVVFVLTRATANSLSWPM